MDNTKNVPIFKLYGEKEQWLTPDLVHCESIAARSQLHNWQIKSHQHSGLFQMLFLRAGNAEIQLDDKHHAMHAGQILLVPQMCVHGFKFDKNAVGYVITIACPLITKISGQMEDALAALNGPSILSLVDDDESTAIGLAFSAMDGEYKRHAPHRNLLIESLLTTILIWASRNARHYSLKNIQANKKGGKHFAHFGRLIEESYASHHLVTYYAGKIGITPAHLNVIARQTTGKSALELVHERLLLEAKRNLVYTTMTINVVSYALGFADPAYFTRFFKRHIGLSPKDFRKQAGTLFEK
jgi:AraC family transcriptional activator of pobA